MHQMGAPGQAYGHPDRSFPAPAAARGTFGLALAGTILGGVALVIAMAALLWPTLSLGLFAYDDIVAGEEMGPWVEDIPITGSLGGPGVRGYTAAEVSTAVNDSIENGYGTPFECPAIPTAMASDLQGRTLACTGTDMGWLVTAFVVFSDADGSFTVTQY